MGGIPGTNVMAKRSSRFNTSSGFRSLRAICDQFWLVFEEMVSLLCIPPCEKDCENPLLVPPLSTTTVESPSRLLTY